MLERPPLILMRRGDLLKGHAFHRASRYTSVASHLQWARLPKKKRSGQRLILRGSRLSITCRILFEQIIQCERLHLLCVLHNMVSPPILSFQLALICTILQIAFKASGVYVKPWRATSQALLCVMEGYVTLLQTSSQQAFGLRGFYVWLSPLKVFKWMYKYSSTLKSIFEKHDYIPYSSCIMYYVFTLIFLLLLLLLYYSTGCIKTM